MTKLTITLDEDVIQILTKKAKNNLLTLREQIEDILRKSAVRSKKSQGYESFKINDRLVSMFSRERRGRKKKK